MPRNVRNFWLTLDVDGSKKQVATGPRSRTGGFDLTVAIREDGSISKKEVEILGRATYELPSGGTASKPTALVLTVRCKDNGAVVSEQSITTIP